MRAGIEGILYTVRFEGLTLRWHQKRESLGEAGRVGRWYEWFFNASPVTGILKTLIHNVARCSWAGGPLPPPGISSLGWCSSKSNQMLEEKWGKGWINGIIYTSWTYVNFNKLRGLSTQILLDLYTWLICLIRLHVYKIVGDERQLFWRDAQSIVVEENRTLIYSVVA